MAVGAEGDKVQTISLLWNNAFTLAVNQFFFRLIIDVRSTKHALTR